MNWMEDLEILIFYYPFLINYVVSNHIEILTNLEQLF